MRSNYLYNLIFDGAINFAELNVQPPIAKATSEGMLYFLIPLFCQSFKYSNKYLQNFHLSKQDCQFEYEEEKYFLAENHISIYKNLSSNEEKTPVLSCYHYTATYQNHTQTKIHIHMYFSCQGTVLNILSGNEKHSFLASKEKINIFNIPSADKLLIEKTANHFCTMLLSSIHTKWSNILSQLKEKISDEQLQVTQLSKAIVTPPYVCENLTAYLQKLETLIELYHQYIAYSPENRTESAILKVLKQNQTIFEQRRNALNTQAKKKKYIKSTPQPNIAMSSSQINDALQQASVSKKTKREQALEKINNQLAAAKENKNATERITLLQTLYRIKLEKLSADDTHESFETITNLIRNHIALSAQLLVIGKNGDIDSFKKMNGFFDEIEYKTIANFFFTLIERGHTDLFDYALKTLDQFNTNTQFIMINRSLLIESCEYKDKEIAYLFVKSLVEHRNISLNNALDFTGATSLHIAVENNNVKLVKLLIEHGHIIDPIQARPDLVTIGQEEEKEELKKIHGKISNAMSQMTITYNTPLLLACSYRYEEIIIILLAMNANPKHRNYLGFNSLGAYLYNSRSNSKETPCSVEIIEKLCEKGCSLDDYQGENKAGATPLFFAAQEGDIETFKILLNMGANLNLRNEIQGLSSLAIACNKNEIAIVALLLDDPSTEITKDDFLFSLYKTLEKQYFDITLLLLTKKPNYWKIIKKIFDDYDGICYSYFEDDPSQQCPITLPDDPNLITMEDIPLAAAVLLQLLNEKVEKIFNENCKRAHAQDRVHYQHGVKTVYRKEKGMKHALRSIRQVSRSQETHGTHSSSSSSLSYSGYHS